MGIAHQTAPPGLRVLAGAVIAVGALVRPLVSARIDAGAAQISEDAQIALEQYGGWRPHPRFGEVWVPDGVPPDWRPYQYGHWVYTDEWGWYWVSDDVEADWGWVVYHYGRWAFERGFGWFWVPGDDWAPAWVDWRYGDEYVGWAPLPPDELIETYEVEPAYWVFVPTRFIGCASPADLLSCRRYRRSVILRETHIVNRTVPVQRTAGGQSRHLASVRRPRERRAGGHLSRASARLCIDARSGRRRAGPARGSARCARRPAGGRARWTWRTCAPRRNFGPAHDYGDSAKRSGHGAAATWQKRARAIGEQSTARGARRPRYCAGAATAAAFDSAAVWIAASGAGHSAANTRRHFAAIAATTSSGSAARYNGACDDCARPERGASRGTSRAGRARRRSAAATTEHRAANPATGVAAAATSTAAATASAATAAASATTATATETGAATRAASAAATETDAATTAAAGCTWSRTASTKAGPSAEEAASEARRTDGREEIAAANLSAQTKRAASPAARGNFVQWTFAVQCINTFLNCQGSRLSMSSGKRPGRPVSGVQSV